MTASWDQGDCLYFSLCIYVWVEDEMAQGVRQLWEISSRSMPGAFCVTLDKKKGGVETSMNCLGTGAKATSGC